MNKSETVSEISKAMVGFQKEVKQPLKDADNPFFKSKYVPLENVVEAITKCAPNHGLSFMQWPLNDEQGRVGVSTIVMHESGEWLEFEPVFMKSEKETPQGAGSTITYLKRYSLSAVFGITSDQDDDGNAGSGNNSNGGEYQANKTTLKSKWQTLNNGSDEGFEEWYNKQKQTYNDNQMNAYLAKKLKERA